jgi:hypothetical protein
MRSSNSVAHVLCVLSSLFIANIGLAESTKEPEKVLRHAVFFKFKDGTSKEDEQKVVDAFDALPKKIDTIKQYERGENLSRIFDDGLTHCFLLTFADDAGRAKYLPHPDHKAFGAVLGPHLDKVFVIDYWGQAQPAAKERQLKHAVFLKFRDDVSDDQVKEVEDALAKLPSQCETVKAFEWGKNNSPETHDEGFTHCFMFTFDNPEDIKTYAETPAHQAVVEKLKATAEKARVLDFWTK